MTKKFRPLIICFLLLTSLSACNGSSKGPSVDAKCMGGDAPATTPSTTGSSSSSSTSDAAMNTAQKIDAALRNCKIITTIVNKVKREVIGQSGFGVPDTGGSSSSSDGSDSSCAADTTSSTSDNLGAKGIFEAFATSAAFQGALGAAFTLYVVLYGVSLASGMQEARLGEAAIKVGKLAGVAAFATSWPFFYQIVGSFFIEGTDEIIGYFLKNFSQFYQPQGAGDSSIANPAMAASAPTDNIFTSLDNFIARVFSYQTYAFVAALFNAGPYAPVYGAIIIMSLFWVLQAIMKVVMVYIFSLFAKALLLAVAPIFITFLLFKPTERMFDAWLRQLVAFSLQPILIMAFIGLFAELLQPFFDQFATYKLCWFQLHENDNKYGWKFAQTSGGRNTSAEYGVNSAPPIGLQTVLMFAFFAWLFRTTLAMVDSIVQGITQSGAAANISQLLALNRITQNESNLGAISKPAKVAGQKL